jgi:D-alanyl-D-alanine carboxypeptidase (penicillin-binding protein 5/6)
LRARGTRTLSTLAFLLLIVPNLAGFAPPAIAQEPGLLPGGPESPAFTLTDLALLRDQPAPPAISARGAIVWDATAGVELFSKAPDERIPPASTGKMMTAIIGIDLLKLDTRITIDQRDISLPEYEESTMQLRAGDVVTFEDLLFGMLLVSGGDAARTTARAAGVLLLAGAPGDPIGRFVQEMNDRAARMGLANTHFVNPHGDDAPGQYSSARDLMRIADEALKRPDFARLAEVKTATRQTVDRSHAYQMRNTNELLFIRPGVHGVKTGTTDGCGQCLVTAQWGPGGRILAVVLGSADRFADTTILLDWTNASYRWFILGQDGTLPGLNAALARWGVTFRDRRAVAVQVWEAPSLRYRLLLDRDLGSPDQPRGEVAFITGTREVLRLPVYAIAPAETNAPGTPVPTKP